MQESTLASPTSSVITLSYLMIRLWSGRHQTKLICIGIRERFLVNVKYIMIHEHFLLWIIPNYGKLLVENSLASTLRIHLFSA